MMQQRRNNILDKISINDDDDDDDDGYKKVDVNRINLHKKDYANLEDYIYELENRTDLKMNNNCSKTPHVNNNSSESDDILAQLERKEKDLILAAELGKALLERNEDLSRANEKITEEYSHKLEASFSSFCFIVSLNLHTLLFTACVFDCGYF